MSGLSRLFGFHSPSPRTWGEEHARFFKAIAHGDLKIIREVAKKYPDAVTWTSPKKQSALLTALKNDEIDAFKLLLDLGANKDERIICPDDKERLASILFYACVKEKLLFIEALLQKGADTTVLSKWTNSAWHTNGDGVTPLTSAIWSLKNGHLKDPRVIDLLKRAKILRDEFLAAHGEATPEDKIVTPVAHLEKKSEDPQNSDYAALLEKMKKLEQKVQKLEKRVEELETPEIVQIEKKKITPPKKTQG